MSMMVSPAFLTHERHPRHPNANIVPIGTAMAVERPAKTRLCAKRVRVSGS